MQGDAGVLTLEHVTITQGDFSLSADFSIADGRRVAVIGPSGAGKSTLLAALCGFVPLSGGRVLWDGRDITGDAPGQRPMAMLFQDNNLFPHMTAAENVMLAPRRVHGATRANLLPQVTTLFERFGLALDRVPGRVGHVRPQPVVERV